MNRAFLIILIPAVLVIGGYIVVLRSMGYPPGYSRLIIGAVIVAGAMYWLSRKRASDPDSHRK